MVTKRFGTREFVRVHARRTMRHIRETFLAKRVRLIHHLDPIQPFDINPGVPARHDEPQRISVFKPYRRSILSVGHDHIIHPFGHRKAVGVAAWIGRNADQPFRSALDADFFQQK